MPKTRWTLYAMPNRFLNTEQKASRAGSFLLYYKTDFHSRMFEQHITNASGGRRGQQSLFLCCRTYNGCKQCYKHAAACACHILLQMRRKQLFISAHILLYSRNIIRHTRRKAFLRPSIKMRFLLFGKRGAHRPCSRRQPPAPYIRLQLQTPRHPYH